MDSPFPFLRTHAASSAASLFVPKSSISSWDSRPPRTFRVPSSRFSTAPSLPLRLPFSNARRLPVAALSGRRGKRRRNHLREKLLHDRKVRPSLTPFGPESDAQAPSFDGILEGDSRKDVPFDCGDEVGGLVESKRGALGESALWSRLENWVDQYKNDLDLWGVGSAPIFTVFQDPDGDVKRVNVNEGEILKRTKVVSPEYEDMNEVNSKIARARGLAREMESGSNVIPRNSSVAKFVVTDAESGFVTAVPNPPLRSALRPKVLAAGTIVLCGVCVLSAVKWFFTLHKREVHYTQLEKEMMRRKIKARQDKEKLEKGQLEVVREASETPNISTQRPHLDKHALAASIQQAKTSSSELAEPKQGCSNLVDGLPVGFDGKIKEIRELAKRARETEGRENSLIEGYEGEKQGKESLYSRKEVIKQHIEDGVSTPDNNHAHAGGSMPANKSNVISTAVTGKYCNGSGDKSLEERNGGIIASSASATGDYSDVQSCRHERTINRISDPTNVCEVQSLDALGGGVHRENAVRKKPKIIRSVKEAREYLSSKFDIQDGNEDVQEKDLGESWINSNLGETTTTSKQSARVGTSGETTDSMVNVNIPRDTIAEEVESIPEMVDNLASDGGVHGADIRTPLSSQKHEASGPTAEANTSKNSQNWIKENSNVVEPFLGKIGDGFRNNYMIAREKANQHLNASIDLTQLHLNEDNGELEWMKDDNLREIVFQVRENELTGKDPFYSMDAEDKRAFFAGLEKKVEKVNVELLKVHEYLHSNIENLDYGADGISIYDPVEKIIPRWKEPPVETKPDFVNKHLKDKKASMTGEAQVSPLMKKDEQNLGEKSAGSQGNGNTASSLAVNSVNNIRSKDPKKTKILIEGSDGSVRTGKRPGKEYWQHTKKWSRGFLDSYNAETDPEVKSVMKDIGKDLDRWITEKDIQEAAELMDKLPERNKEYIGKKLNKLKREMELFGPHAVVSKYREYAEDKDEDFLWWLDLPHVLVGLKFFGRKIV